MVEKPQQDKDRDEPVHIPLDPEQALRGLLAVDPDSESVEAYSKKPVDKGLSSSDAKP